MCFSDRLRSTLSENYRNEAALYDYQPTSCVESSKKSLIWIIFVDLLDLVRPEEVASPQQLAFHHPPLPLPCVETMSRPTSKPSSDTLDDPELIKTNEASKYSPIKDFMAEKPHEVDEDVVRMAFEIIDVDRDVSIRGI